MQIVVVELNKLLETQMKLLNHIKEEPKSVNWTQLEILLLKKENREQLQVQELSKEDL